MAEMRSGDHFNLFYEDVDELIDVLVLYFKAGLDNNDCCVWEISPPLTIDSAVNAMINAGIDVDHYISSGQLVMFPYTQWLTPDGELDFNGAANGLIEMYQDIIMKGFTNMRYTGDVSMVSDDMWSDFIEFENASDTIIKTNRIICLCTYPFDLCSKLHIIDGISTHEGTIIKGSEGWTILKDVFRERYKKNIRNMKVHIENLIKISHDAIFLVNEDQKFEFCNDACFDILGWSKESLIGKSMLEVIAPESHDFFLDKWNAIHNTKKETYEPLIVKGDGTKRRMLVSHTNIDIDGNNKHFFILKDTTYDVDDYIEMISMIL